eukprot:81158-Pleurochrysis_carterae.AAC.2
MIIYDTTTCGQGADAGARAERTCAVAPVGGAVMLRWPCAPRVECRTWEAERGALRKYAYGASTKWETVHAGQKEQPRFDGFEYSTLRRTLR